MVTRLRAASLRIALVVDPEAPVANSLAALLCGEGFHVSTTRLRHPHPLECDECHHVSSLVVTTEAA